MKTNNTIHKWLRPISIFMLICALSFALDLVLAQSTSGIDIDKGAGGVYKKGEIVNIKWDIQEPVESLRLKAKDANGVEFLNKNIPGGSPETVAKSYSLNLVMDHPSKAESPIGTYKIDLEENYKKPVSGQIYQKRYGLDFFYAEAIGFLNIAKFNDENGDGIKQNNEVGLPNWEFEISGPNGFKRKLSTNGNGEVPKENVPAGEYIIRELLQPGWESTTPLEQKTTVYDNKITSIAFGNKVLTGNLTIVKYLDENQNGKRDPGEKGLKDWDFTVVGLDTNRVIVTGIDGTAKLEKLKPGIYTIRETTKAGWLSKAPEEQKVTLTGKDDKEVAFGNYVNFGTFTILAFQDKNINGILERDPNGLPKETGLAGWDIVIGFPDGSNKTFQTDASGLISNVQLQSGIYTIKEVSKTGWIGTTRSEQQLELLPGGNKIVEFGNYQPGIVTKYWDKNSNRLRDSGEPALSGWTFKITGPIGSITKITDSDGNIILTGLPEGKYEIEEVIADDTNWYNTTPRIASIALPGGNLSFGNDKYRTLEVFNFNDPNKNGIHDTNESGLEGWEFQVSGIDVPSLTNSNGIATFKVKANQKYLVSESLPANWLNSTPLEVSVQIDPTKNVSEAVFGDYQIPASKPAKASLKIHVYNDSNRDGTFNSDEPGLSNREVQITNLDDSSSTYSSFTANNNGDIECSLPAGTYKAEQILLSSWCTNGDILNKVTLKANDSDTIYFGSYPCISGNCEYRFKPPQGNLSSTAQDENLLVTKSIDPYVISLKDHDMTKGALINYTITVCAKPKIGPTDLILAVDTSGSVIEGDNAALSNINRGINGFVQAMKGSQNSDLRIGLVSWDSDIDETIKPTFSYEQVLNASNKLRANPRELTMYQVGMNGTLDAFDASPRDGARKVIVFITDARNEYEPFQAYPDPSKYTIYVLLLNKPEINETYDMLSSMTKKFGGKLIQVEDSATIASALTSLSKTSLIANGTVNEIKIVDTLPSYLRPLDKGTQVGTLNVNGDGVNWKTSSLSWSIPAIQYGKCWSTTFTAVFCWKLQANVVEPLNSSRTTSQVEYADPAKTGRKIIPLPEGTIWIESDVNAADSTQSEKADTISDTKIKEEPGFQGLLAAIGISLTGFFYRRRVD